MTTEPTANEVAAPEFKLSEAGAALRAQLDAARPAVAAARANAGHPGLADGRVKDFGAQKPEPTPKVKDSEGREVDLTTGETTLAKPDGTAYAVVPELALIPQEHHEEAQQLAVDLEAVGQAHGYSAEMMQTALDAGADLFLTAERDLTLTTREQGLSAMATRYGQNAADRIVSEAQRMTQWLGADFSAFMETSGLGNSIATLNVLAAKFRGDLDLTPEKAREKIAELRKGDHAMDRDVVDRVKILARVAAKKAPPQPDATTIRPASGNPFSTLTHQSGKELRAELDALQAKDSPLWDSDNTKRKKAVARRQQIQAALAAKGDA